jgi:hypothetical protein
MGGKLIRKASMGELSEKYPNKFVNLTITNGTAI